MNLNLDKSGWKHVCFGDVAVSSKEKVDPTDGSIDRYVAGEHMDTDDLRIHHWGDVSEKDLGPAFHRRFRPGQVLYGSRRTYLRKVSVADFDGVCANTTFVVETADSTALLQEFLPVVMSSEPFHAHAIGESKGSVNPYVNWSDVAKFQLDLPPIDQQKRIADLLWAIERERRSVADFSTVVERVRTTTRDEIFRSLTAPPSRFDSICSIPSQNGASLKKSERAGKVPMVNMGEMFRGEVISLESNYERVAVPDEHLLLDTGDLLFARRSIVFEGAGACCLVPELDEPYTFESSVIRSRIIPEKVDPHFVLHFFRSQRGRAAISQIVRRGPVSGIAGSDLRKIEIPVPDLATQRKIVETIGRIGIATSHLGTHFVMVRDLQRALLSEIYGAN